MTTRYLKSFEKIFNFTRFLSELCGADVVTVDYRTNWITWSLIVLINFSIAFTFYSMHVAVAIKNDWSEILKCLCMFGAGIQGYAKLINAIKRPYMFRYLHNEIVGVYSCYQKKTSNYHQHLNESIKLFKNLIAILFLIAVMVMLAVIGIPFFYQIVFRKRIFVMPFFLPYVNYESDFGYHFTTIYHIVCVVFGVMGNFVSDIWCFTFAAHIPFFKNILQVKFKELDDMLQESIKKEEDDIKQLLTDIFKWHQKYIVFCETVKNLFFWVIFVQVFMEFISIVCTIVCIFLGVWPAAPVYLIYSFVLFYFYCALGNLVELSNDDVTTMIYDCCWYKLTILQQKMILIMLRKSQQAEGMSIGGVAPLTLNTALQITKTIYTFSMMLRNFLN